MPRFLGRWAFAIVFTTLFWQNSVSFGQDSLRTIVVSEGRAEAQLKPDDDVEKVKLRLRQLAMIDAIEKAFGSYVAVSKATTLNSRTAGEDAHTVTQLKMIADTYVKGDWIRDHAVNFENVSRGKGKNAEKWLVCTVKGECSELKEPNFFLDVATLNCPQDSCSATVFQDGQPFYVSFRSPVKGYLSVWLDDRSQIHCLIPYLNQGDEAAMAIEADKKYILFSQKPEHNYFKNPAFLEDELLLTADSPKQASLNRLFVVFSPTPYRKPTLEGARLVRPEEKPKLKGCVYPRHLAPEQFMEWIARNRTVNEQFKVQVADIEILPGR